MTVDLAGVPFVDGHLHPPLRERPATPDDYAWPWYEGDRSTIELARDLVPYRWGLAQLGTRLGCAPVEADVIAAIAARSGPAWTAECMEWGGVGGLVVDTGYPLPLAAVAVEELAASAGVPTARLVRIELVAEQEIRPDLALSDWLERVRARLIAELDAGAAGLKTIVAYRTGLGIGPVDRVEAEVAYNAIRTGDAVRLAAKPLNDLLVLEALALCRERDVPLQLHAGYGDRDIDLRAGTPLAFRWALEVGGAAAVDCVFLHAAWPHIRDAAVLAAVYDRVYVDIACCVPPLGHAALVTCWREALAVAPLSRIHASSDAAGLIEHVAIGGVRARATLAIALSELVASGELGAVAARDAGERILAGNARDLYRLD